MDISLTSIKKPIVDLLHRFHFIIFVVVVFGGLAVVVFTLNGIVIQSGESNGYASSSNNATFDQATIDRIKQLRTSSEGGSQLDFANGRYNPFVE
jgi:hypothetical protein